MKEGSGTVHQANGSKTVVVSQREVHRKKKKKEKKLGKKKQTIPNENAKKEKKY